MQEHEDIILNELFDITFLKPLIITHYHEDGYCILKNDEYNLHAYWNDNCEDAKRELYEELQHLIGEIMNEHDDNLTPDAQALKQHLRGLIKK